MSQVHSLFENLKRELKAKGLTYKDVAEHLELTESSVKRLFSQEDLSIQRLDKVCELLGIDLADLTNPERGDSRVIVLMSEKQEREIAQDEKTLTVSFLVYQGWTFEEILKYFEFSEPELIRILALLDRLSLIELLPKNRIKLKVAHNLGWRKGGAIQKFYVEHFQGSFMRSYFRDQNEYLRLISGMYTPLTCSVILKKLQKLTFEVFQLSQEDRKVPLDERIPFGVLIAARPWRAEFFDKFRRTE